MNEPIYVTIGIPFYNAEKYLKYAITSVLAQTHPYWELILVNDGSRDNSLVIAKYFERLDNRIRVISDGENKRLPFRLNQINKEAKYDYIARMDADDIMATDRIEKQLTKLIQDKQIDFVASSIFTISNNNDILGKRFPKNAIMNASEILQGLTNIVHPSVLVRKSWYMRNPYIEGNLLAEDFELWLTAAMKNDLRYQVIQEPLLFYREVENVKKEKILRGYDTQMTIIKHYYNGIISDGLKNRIILRFKFKKMIVRFLNACGLMWILQKKRVTNFSDADKKLYESHLNKINNTFNQIEDMAKN